MPEGRLPGYLGWPFLAWLTQVRAMVDDENGLPVEAAATLLTSVQLPRCRPGGGFKQCGGRQA